MVKYVPLDQTSHKMNKDENIRTAIHLTWELVAQKENMLLLPEIYLLANSTLETCVLEAILMMRLSFGRLLTFASAIFSYLARSSLKLSFGLLLFSLSWPLPPSTL
jgi:hypothetical protein